MKMHILLMCIGTPWFCFPIFHFLFFTVARQFFGGSGFRVECTRKYLQRTLSVLDLPSAWGFGSPFHLHGMGQWFDFHHGLGHTKKHSTWNVACTVTASEMAFTVITG